MQGGAFIGYATGGRTTAMLQRTDGGLATVVEDEDNAVHDSNRSDTTRVLRCATSGYINERGRHRLDRDSGATLRCATMLDDIARVAERDFSSATMKKNSDGYTTSNDDSEARNSPFCHAVGSAATAGSSMRTSDTGPKSERGRSRNAPGIGGREEEGGTPSFCRPASTRSTGRGSDARASDAVPVSVSDRSAEALLASAAFADPGKAAATRCGRTPSGSPSTTTTAATTEFGNEAKRKLLLTESAVPEKNPAPYAHRSLCPPLTSVPPLLTQQARASTRDVTSAPPHDSSGPWKLLPFASPQPEETYQSSAAGTASSAATHIATHTATSTATTVLANAAERGSSSGTSQVTDHMTAPAVTPMRSPAAPTAAHRTSSTTVRWSSSPRLLEKRQQSKLSDTLLTCRAVAMLRQRLFQRQQEYDSSHKGNTLCETDEDDSSCCFYDDLTLRDSEREHQPESVPPSPSLSPHRQRQHPPSSPSSATMTVSTPASLSSPVSLRTIVGDIGLALFNPLDESAFLPPPVATPSPTNPTSKHRRTSQQDSSSGCFLSLMPHYRSTGKKSRIVGPTASGLKGVTTSTTCALYMEDEDDDDSADNCNTGGSGTSRRNSDDEIVSLVDTKPKRRRKKEELCIFNHEVYPVHLVDEPMEDLQLAPRILNEAMFHQIVNEAIPRSLRIYKWERVFSISRDGDAFITMLEKCAGYKNTLVVVRTTKGNILGGFASEYWRGMEARQERKTYFGTGTCFLFSDFPKPQTEDPGSQLNIYPWTGSNDYCQICDIDRHFIAMGGGDGNFGLVVKESFLYGTTGHCATFGNPSLIPGIDGTFDVQEFEIWGMVPLFPSVVKPLSKRYSDVSLLDSSRFGSV